MLISIGLQQLVGGSSTDKSSRVLICKKMTNVSPLNTTRRLVNVKLITKLPRDYFLKNILVTVLQVKRIALLAAVRVVVQPAIGNWE